MRLKLLIISLLVALTLSASTATDAEKYYRAGEWAKAETLYAKLLKSAPSNRIYNHRYGVSLYEQNKDLAKAEKHLLRSKKAGISLSAFYLGRVCFLQYKFDDAIAYYQFFMSKSNDKEKKQAIKEYLPKCVQGKEMISRVEDVKILDRVEVDKVDFFLNYNVGEEAGSFLKDAADIGEDIIAENSTIYITERGDRAFFALEEEEGYTNLYAKNRLIDQWAEKTSLGESVNTTEDEAYPFLMSDGIKLYFSSKGHNSFGGYDIYVTRYNASQNTYLPPQQLGMPFNSLGDDILFAIDEYNNVGWFASDRDSEEGRIAIYTFEPNETFQLLDTDDEKERIKAALISDTDTSTAVSIITENTSIVANKPEVESHDIYFVVNDTLIYSDINDFMSEDAKELFVQYESAQEAYDSTSLAVSEARVLYSRTTDSEDKAQLISEIMTLESLSFDLEEQRDKLLLATRRIELETIRANGGYTKPKPVVVAAPVVRTEVEEKHISAWETPVPTVTDDEVTIPFFYDKTLYDYYDQIYSAVAIEKLVEANKMKTQAGDKQFLADYVMREYNKPVPEPTFFENIFSYDTTLTPKLTQAEITAKVKSISDEGALLFVEGNYLSYYTLKGQNVLLLETVKEAQYREEMQGLMDRAAFSLQQADQKIYVSEGVYTNNREQLAQGNNLLKESIQLLEATTLTYLKYRYEAKQGAKAEKPKPVEVKEEVAVAAAAVPVVAASEAPVRTEVAPKEVKEESTVPAEEYRIQFGIFSRILKEGDVKLDDLSYYQYSDKELYKFFSGHYATPMDAAISLEEAKAKGFKDAFVVKFVDGVLEE